MPTQQTPTRPKLTDADLVKALDAARVHPIIAADIRRRRREDEGSIEGSRLEAAAAPFVADEPPLCGIAAEDV